jgi:hypothetical protein
MPSARTSLAVLTLVCVLVWWQATRPASPPAAGHASGPAGVAGSSRCPLPPRIQQGDEPLQTAVPGGMSLPPLGAATLQPLAGFSIEARVLGREDYQLGRESEFSPTDLALGWGPMTEDAVVSRLQISQSSRWYRYRWEDAPPIPLQDIIRSSANMHMIPADDAVAAALRRIERGDRVRIDGWLVQVEDGDWRWRSSLTRDDSGGGACELVYVCSITRE